MHKMSDSRYIEAPGPWIGPRFGLTPYPGYVKIRGPICSYRKKVAMSPKIKKLTAPIALITEEHGFVAYFLRSLRDLKLLIIMKLGFECYAENFFRLSDPSPIN